MTIITSSRFRKRLKEIAKGNRERQKEIREVIKLLESNPEYPGLRLHQTRHNYEEYWSISLADDLRIVFYYFGENIVLVDIGSHQKVYEEN